MSRRRLILVQVDSQPEEERALRSRECLSLDIFPVRDSGGIMRRIAVAQGCEVQTITFEQFSRIEPVSQPEYERPQSLAIISCGTIEPDLIHLSTCLLPGTMLTTADVHAGIAPSVEHAVIIYDGESPGELCDIMCHLSDMEIPFGLIPSTDSAAGRLAILKAALFTDIQIDDIEWLDNRTLDNTDALSSFPIDGSSARRRILVSAGHGNAMDLGKAGPQGFALCGRTSKVTVGTANTYPCFSDGQCFRQPLFGRSPASSLGLINSAELPHPIVMLLGCGTMPLGNVPFSFEHTIVGRMLRTETVAGFGTLGVFFHDLDSEMFPLNLLLDGYSLGQTARIFNDWYHQTYSYNCSKKPYGPLVAFGRPDLRIRSSMMRRIANDGAGKQELNLPATVDFSPSGVAYFGITPSPFSLDRNDVITDVGNLDSLVRLSLVDRRQPDTMYVTLKCQDGPPSDVINVNIKSVSNEKRRCELSVLADSAFSLGYWRIILSNIGASQQDNHRSELQAARIEHEHLEDALLRYLSANSAGSSTGFASSHKSMMSTWWKWQRAMFDVALNYVRSTGGFVFHLWQASYPLSREAHSPRQCPNCHREKVPIRYTSIVSASDAHDLVDCDVCGVMGELPPEIGVISTELQSVDKPSRVLFEARVENRKSVAVNGFFTVIRECWFRTAPDIMRPVRVKVPKESVRQLAFSVEISSQLTTGLYPLTLIGILNGRLVHLRFHAPITV